MQIQSQIVFEHKHQRANSVAAVVLVMDATKEAGDAELVDALKSKYDALKDKLLMESLMNQVGGQARLLKVLGSLVWLFTKDWLSQVNIHITVHSINYIDVFSMERQNGRDYQNRKDRGNWWN